MSVRRPDLEEWFLDLQLRAIVADHVHCTGVREVDVTPLAEAWRRVEEARVAQEGGPARGLPWTAAGVQAAAELVARRPHLNRALFRTPIGARVVEFPYVAVNLPVRLADSGHLSALLVKAPHTRSLRAVADEIRAFRQRPLASMPVGRLFIGNRSTLWNRLRLRALHWASRRLPWAYLRAGGGGVSVSSMLHRGVRSPSTWAAGLGPTGLTFTLCGVREIAGRTTLTVALAFDHALLTGDEVWEGVDQLEACFAGVADRVG